MTDLATRGPELLEADRDCTRCDGVQSIVAAELDMGSYRCDSCGMHVGFDLEDDPAEFLIDRGMPARYTRDVFGDRLLPDERRLPA